MRLWLKVLAILAGLFGAIGVGLAAVGAHRSATPIVTTAADFLLFHAAALAALCAIARSNPGRGLLTAATTIAAGTILFSGDLAVRGLADVTIAHLAAPTGGTLMIVGWLIAAFALPANLDASQDISRQPTNGFGPDRKV